MAAPPPSPDFGALQQLVRAWLERYYPAWRSATVRADVGEPEPLAMPIPRDRSLQAAASSLEGDDTPIPQLAPSRCSSDILLTLEESGRPLTRTRLLAAMARQQREWSERTVAGELARMVEDGTLTNERGVGYGLPEWPPEATGPR